MIQKYFGRAVRTIRESKQISQEELAIRCLLHRTYISDVERGKRNVSLISIFSIAKGLDVSVSHIFKLAEKYLQEENQ